MAILTILILWIQEHGISLQFFESSLTSFINVLWFSVYKSFTCLFSFIPKYLLCNFKVYYCLTYPFCYFIVSVKKCNQFLYVNLLFWIPLSVLVVFVRRLSDFLYLVSCHLHIIKMFTFSLPIWIPLIFLSDCCG